MTPHNSWNTPWDDDDIVSGDESPFDAFDAFLPAQEGIDAETSLEPRIPQESCGDNAPLTFLFTAANPAETISVTAMMGGQIVNIELSPKVTQMTEAELGKEITVIAALARRQALAAVHVVVTELMRQQEMDGVSTSTLLEHEYGLPSPQTVRAERARLFAAQSSEDHY